MTRSGEITRRAALARFTAWCSSFAAAAPRGRTLVLHRPRFGETLAIPLDAGRRMTTPAPGRLDWFLRDLDDLRASVDPGLIRRVAALGSEVARLTRAEPRFEVVDAFPARQGVGGGWCEDPISTALHRQGRAIDIRVRGCAPQVLREAAISVSGGGVGVYLSSSVVHIDTGAWRRWSRRLI